MIAETRKQPKYLLTDEWIGKTWYSSTMKCDSAIKKNATMLFATTWVDLEMIILNAAKSDKDKVYTISLTCGIRKNSTNELM